MEKEIDTALKDFLSLYHRSSIYREIEELSQALKEDKAFQSELSSARKIIEEYSRVPEKDRKSLLIELSQEKARINNDSRMSRIRFLSREVNSIFSDLNGLLNNRPDKDLEGY